LYFENGRFSNGELGRVNNDMRHCYATNVCSFYSAWPAALRRRDD
jgi:hypothetical protein